MEKYKRSLPPQWEPTRRQHDEKMYYVPCSHCSRTLNQIKLEGSERCWCKIGSITEKEGRERSEKQKEWLSMLYQEEISINDTGFSVKK